MPLKHHARTRTLLAEAYLRLLRARGSHVRWGRGPVFWDAMPTIDARGEIELGAGVSVHSEPVRSRITAAPGGRVEIGDRSSLNYGIEIFAQRSVKIGACVRIGDLAVIYDTNFHPVEEGVETKVAPVEIGANAWIGRGALILPGVTIGEHAVAAAEAVVTHDIPPRTIAAGNPAKIVREGLRASDDWCR